MTYEEAVAYIASLAPRGWRLGLDRMQELARRVGIQDVLGQSGGPQYIHVTGTNGKGSVTAYVQSILTHAGYRVGAYFSPFVYDFRERFQLNGEVISKEDLARLTADLIRPAESLSSTEFGGATEFEFKTALAFAFWKEKKCDWVALEVGLGGRLDATNIITPRASVITSIALDHMTVLGHSLEEIAYEKAGIIKEGKPVVVGSLPPEALHEIEKVAKQKSAPLWLMGREVVVEDGAVSTPGNRYREIASGIKGAWQMHNAALAIAAVEAAGVPVAEANVREAVEATRLPGRFEQAKVWDRDAVLDGAHNAAAASALVEGIRGEYPGREVVLLTGMVQGHDPAEFYRPFAGLACEAFVVPIDFHRAMSPEDIVSAAGHLLPMSSCTSLETGVKAARSSLGKDDLLVVTGSFYLLGQVKGLLDC